MVQKEGPAPLIADGIPRDFPEIVGKSWPIHRRSGRPSSRPLNATKGSLLSESLPPRYRIG